MSEQFWKKKQDPVCAAAIAAVETHASVVEAQSNALRVSLTQQLDNLGTVVEELAADIGRLRAELQTRYQVLDSDVNAMESRLVTRIETLEDSDKPAADYSTAEGETPVGGYKKWSQKKREAMQKVADPTVFTKAKSKPEAPASEEK